MMLYTGVAIAVAVIAALFLIFALRFLLRRSWFMGWLRGMFGLGLIAVALSIGFIAWELSRFDKVFEETPIANLSFKRLGGQSYEVSLSSAEGETQTFTLKGDLWQLDARLVKWHENLVMLGMAPGYRLDRLSGRYFSLEDEKNLERTVYELNQKQLPLDLWQLVQTHHELFGGVVDARYGNATFLPMEDGALFSVTLSHAGLVARPLNEQAKTAVNAW